MKKNQVHLFYVVDKWKYLVLISTVAIVGVAFFVTKRIQLEYSASSKLHLEVTMQNFDPFATNVEFQGMKSFFESNKMFALYVLGKEKMLKSNPSLAARVKPTNRSDSAIALLKFLGSDTNVSADSLVRVLDTVPSLYKMIEKFRKKTTIKPYADVNVLEFSYKDLDPLVAYKVTDMIGRTCVNEFTKEKRKKLFVKAQYLKKEIAGLENHLYKLKSSSTILNIKTKIDIDLTEKKLEDFYGLFVKADMELKEPDISAINLKILAPALYNPKPVLNSKIILAGLIIAGFLILIWMIVLVEYFSASGGIAFFVRNASRTFFLCRFPGQKQMKELQIFFEYLSGRYQPAPVALCAFPGNSFKRAVSLLSGSRTAVLINLLIILFSCALNIKLSPKKLLFGTLIFITLLGLGSVILTKKLPEFSSKTASMQRVVQGASTMNGRTFIWNTLGNLSSTCTSSESVTTRCVTSCAKLICGS